MALEQIVLGVVEIVAIVCWARSRTAGSSKLLRSPYRRHLFQPEIVAGPRNAGPAAVVSEFEPVDLAFQFGGELHQLLADLRRLLRPL